MSKKEKVIIDSINGKVVQAGNNIKSFVGDTIDKISDIPNFAKEILKSSDKSEESYHEFAKMDKETIDMLIKNKMESGNYTDEELESLLEKSIEITEKSDGRLDKSNEHREKILLIVAGSMIGVVKLMLESNKNNQNNQS